jgi:hypothetical protein
MRDVLFSTNECDGVRFETLVEYLAEARKADADDAFRMRVLGHLTKWFSGWARDDDFDHGLFFGFKLSMVARWSGWANPAEFARGLLHAGYVKELGAVYPKELAVEGGFVVVGALDRSWGVHRCRTSVASRLVLFLVDPIKRNKWAQHFGIAPSMAPEGWLKRMEEMPPAMGGAMAEAPAPMATEPASGPKVIPMVAAQRPGACIPGISPVKIGFTPQPSPCSPFTGTDNDPKKGMNIPSVPVEGLNEGTDPPRPKGRTALPATATLYELVHANRYENPLYALTAMDRDTEWASWCRHLCDQHRADVMHVLANMTETRERFLHYGAPACVFTRAIKKIIPAGNRPRARASPAETERGSTGRVGGSLTGGCVA